MHRHAAVTQLGLRVGFDYWPAATHAPGIGRYLRELVRALGEQEGGPRLALLDVGPEGEFIPEAALGLPRSAEKLMRRTWRARRGWLSWSERCLGLRAESWLSKIDVFQRAWPLGAPSARAPQLVALAELPAADSKAEATLREALQRMAAVLVFSAHAQSEVQRRFMLAPEKVQIVPVGCDHWLRDLGASGKPRERMRFLVLGAVREGSGHVEILEAFQRLRGRGLDADLVFCGRRGDEAPRLESALRSNAFKSDVRWIDEPVESEMPTLVCGASVLVHLPREAWTAVTPLEAMSFGLAVLTSRLPCFVEALGEQAEYVDSDPAARPAAELDAALDRAILSASNSAAMERRRTLARPFSWSANARATLAVYEDVARERRSKP